MSKKSLLIIFLLCAIIGLTLIVAGGISLVPRKWFTIALGAGTIFLFLCWSLQNAFFKKQQESVIDSIELISETSDMDSDRFCEIAEALRDSDTVIGCTLGDEITWQDVLFAINQHSDEIFQETGIFVKELKEWEQEAILHHVDSHPFTEEIT